MDNRIGVRDLRIFAVAAVVLLITGYPALGAPRYFDDCTAADSTVMLRLEACTFSLQADGLDDKQRVQALLNRARGYTAKFLPWNAKADLDQAQKIAPDDPAITAALADLSHLLLGRQQAAIAGYKQQAAQTGGDAATLTKLGMSYIMANDFASAQKTLSEVLAKDPDNVEALIWRSTTYTHSKQYDLSMADLDRAVERQPQNILARQWRAEVALYLGAFDKATGDLNLVLAARKRDSLHRFRGIAEYASGGYSAAAADFETDLDVDPVFANLAIWQYFAQRRQGNDSTAELLRIMGLLQGEWPTPLFKYVLGQASADEALAATDDLDPKLKQVRQSQAHSIIGEWLLMQGHSADARVHFQSSNDIGVVVADQAVREGRAVLPSDTVIEFALARARLKELSQ